MAGLQLSADPCNKVAPSHIGDPCPRRQALHHDLGFLVCRPPPPPHRAGDHLNPTIRLILMPALITALIPAAIHWTPRSVASASVSEITRRCRKVVHSHRLPMDVAKRPGMRRAKVALARKLATVLHRM